MRLFTKLVSWAIILKDPKSIVSSNLLRFFNDFFGASYPYSDPGGRILSAGTLDVYNFFDKQAKVTKLYDFS